MQASGQLRVRRGEYKKGCCEHCQTRVYSGAKVGSEKNKTQCLNNKSCSCFLVFPAQV